jgi:hypothetical protein
MAQQTAVKWLLNLFKQKCPKCKAPMNSSFFDMKFDYIVFECTKCKKEWI